MLWRLPLPLALAWRYMRGRQSRMLQATALAALVATTLGVMAMVIAMALMTGYTEDLERKLIGLQGEIIASPVGSERDAAAEDRLTAAAGLPGVARLGRVVYGEGALSSPTLPEGLSVVLRGVDSDDPIVARSGGSLQTTAEAGRRPPLPGAILGEELARRLGAKDGDILRLVILDLGSTRPRFRYRSIEITGIFTTGFAEFDARWVLLDRGILQQGARDRRFEMVEFELTEPADTVAVAEAVSDTLGDGWVVERWQYLNRGLFAALALQETLLFLVLGLIVFVSTFNVASTLVILVRERMRDIGVLASIGLTPRRIWWCFAGYGLLLGAAGIALGVAAGAAVSWIITEFELVRFPPELAAVYFISSVPFRVEAGDLAAIIGFSLTVTLLASALPALRAAEASPSAALRTE